MWYEDPPPWTGDPEAMNEFLWNERCGVIDGTGYRLAFIHVDCSRGVRLRVPGQQTVPDKWFSNHEAAQDHVTRTLIELGMIERPVEFPRMTSEPWTTITQRMTLSAKVT